MNSLAATERALMTALNTIKENWDALIAAPSSGGVAAKPAPRSLYTRNDTDDRDDDLPNLDRRIALRHDVTLALNGWAKLIVDERALTHHLPLGTDTIGLVEFLERWARWFSGHEAAGDAADELTTWAGRVRSAVDPARREWALLGECPLEVAIDGIEQGKCGGQVRAYPKRLPQCHRCGTEAVWPWWEKHMFPDIDTAEFVTAEQVVTLMHRAFGGERVKPGTVRQWASRGYFQSTGVDHEGRTLYNRRHVIKAMSERNANSG